MVTHHTTNSPACGLSTAERTGSPVFHTLWSYVLDGCSKGNYIYLKLGLVNNWLKQIFVLLKMIESKYFLMIATVRCQVLIHRE